MDETTNGTTRDRASSTVTRRRRPRDGATSPTRHHRGRGERRRCLGRHRQPGSAQPAERRAVHPRTGRRGRVVAQLPARPGGLAAGGRTNRHDHRPRPAPQQLVLLPRDRRSRSGVRRGRLRLPGDRGRHERRVLTPARRAVPPGTAHRRCGARQHAGHRRRSGVAALARRRARDRRELHARDTPRCGSTTSPSV